MSSPRRSPRSCPPARTPNAGARKLHQPCRWRSTCEGEPPVTHLVFVDSNFAGIEALRRAKALGYQFSAVMSEGLMLYHMNDATRRALAGADRVLWIERTTDRAQLA